MSTHTPFRPQPRFALFRGRPLVIIAYGGLATEPLVLTFVRAPHDAAIRLAIGFLTVAALFVGMAAGIAVIRGWWVGPATAAVDRVAPRAVRLFGFAMACELGVWSVMDAYRIFGQDDAPWSVDFTTIGLVVAANAVFAATLPTAINAWDGEPPTR